MTYSTNCTYRRAATLYTLETWFVNTLQKGDSMDDDDDTDVD